MIWKTLHNYLEEHCSTIVELLPHICKRADKKAIHKLRVTIKRTRACLALAAYVTAGGFKGKKYTRLLGILQRVAGTLRDLQLKQELLRQYAKRNRQDYRLFQVLLLSGAQLEKQQAQSIADTFPIKEIRKLPEVFHTWHHHEQILSAEDIMAYLQEQFAAITPPKGRVKADEWHDVRKQVKRLHFQLELLQPALPIQEGVQQMLDYTKKAGGMLGDWHDQYSLLLFVRNNERMLRTARFTLPAGIARLREQLQADVRSRLQQCRQFLQQKPAQLNH